MPEKVLVAYASRYGSTEEVAEAVAAALQECGFAADLRVLRDVRKLDGYGGVVLGAPLFMFHWHKDALGFLARQQAALEQMPVAIFVLGPVHEPHDEAEWKGSWAQLDKELAQFPWLKPVALEMFGGKYDPDKLGFPLKMFAGKEPASDLRDWDLIRRWASGVGDKLHQVMAQG
jgi:menaquinone-dependent protoporphyrinogen oxidase